MSSWRMWSNQLIRLIATFSTVPWEDQDFQRGSAGFTSSIGKSGYGSNWPRGQASLGLEIVVFPKDAPSACFFIVALYAP